jgi:hypothetical protein
MMVWAVLQSFGSLVDRRAVGSGGPYFSSVIVFHLFFVASVVLCWRCKCLLTPVIACLCFVASVLSMLEMQVSLITECQAISVLNKASRLADGGGRGPTFSP